MSSNYNDPYNSYISQLNILNPVNLPEMSQEDLDAHLEFWSNAQFTFEVQQPNMNLMEDTFDVDTKMEQDALITAQPTMLTQQDTSSISDTSQAQQTIYHPILSYPTASSIMTTSLQPIPVAPATTTTSNTTTFPPIFPAPSVAVTDNVIKDDVAMSPGATSKSTTTGITNPPSRKNSSSKGSKTDSNVIHTDSQASQDPDLSAKLAAEEDKRRRNTAASARFRVKKKIREQALERTVKEMTTKAETLEGRVKELEMEIKWLRSLVVEKDARLLDIERPDKKHKSVTENKSTEESIKSESNDKSNKKVRSQDTK
ncbi:regulatory protein cys-3 [Gigaspora margarita]|uniref:Regulatory protein cys-3 n=1 Tax=Gigaspora margarita TaxID=4874 RepID=A0A8H3X2S1_GIGMA|nr:regulatory protein cys-3 [Gigaspora margarita]